MLNRSTPDRCGDCSCSRAEVRRAGGCPLYLPQSSSLGQLHVPKQRAPIGWRVLLGAVTMVVATLAFGAVVLLDLHRQGWTLTP